MATPEDGVDSSYGSGGLFSASEQVDVTTAVTCDVLYVGILTAFLVVLVSFFVIFPTFKGPEEKLKVFFRVASCMVLGLVIMVCNYGQQWEVGVITTSTPYKAGSGQEIRAQLGLYLGLRSVNITLKAVDDPRGDLAGEKIDYNERFTWTWAQGNAGFGPNAGTLQREFRRAQETGLPLPILWAAEYFIIDGEGIRFGRHYRYSGWFAHICVWTAFPLWIVTMVLFKMVIRIAAQTLALTGIMLLSSAIIWATNRNYTELQIPFEDGILTTKYGLHWYLALVMGALCTVAGVAIYLYDYHHPGSSTLNAFFGNNPYSIVEEVTRVEEEEKPPPTTTTGTKKPSMRKAGRRVVTTLKAFGTTHCLKKVTHVQGGDWSTSPSFSQSSENSTRRR
ncbi:dual oxidase maturation factor 1-like [Portunus trituberculatus]|uniref:dual oxidase maturation factor 1-like n=1 Tax=Portunus trituberculatus TaxID=210409 RepID=UPI001E1CDEEA|nr:dual oxidase maturation factor 1-like [Portunus trituberculatus]